MLYNFLKSGFRNLFRNPVFSFINVTGLALGLTCGLLIFLWVIDEMKFDSFHKHEDRLYSIYERTYNDGKVTGSFATQGLLYEELKRAIPEVEYACAYWSFDPSACEANTKILKMEGASAGESFFHIFDFPLIHGLAETALSDPSNIVLSRKMAESFFGSTSKAMGQSIRFDNRKDLIVTGVFEDVPKNSSLRFDFLSSWESRMNDVVWLNQWIYRTPQTYLLLRPDADVAGVENKIKNFVTPYLENSSSSFRIELGLQRFRDKYLHSVFHNGIPAGGRIGYVQLFSVVAVVVMIIACINFMNLSTARSIRRAKEVGVRKAVGAMRALLTAQFLTESLVITLLSLVLSAGMIMVLLPYFNELTGKDIALPFASPLFWVALLLMWIGTGIVAGSYPALFLSSLHPVKILKGSLKSGEGVAQLRKVLVVFQFVLSVLMISGAFIVSRQVLYLQNKNLGFDTENLIYIPMQGRSCTEI